MDGGCRMKEDIVVVGGYGHVGQSICRELGEIYPGKVYAAGRSLERAAQFSGTTGGKVRPLRIDTNEKLDRNLLNRIKLVIMCLDQSNIEFVQQCLSNGIRYIDVSANGAFLNQVEQLQAEAVCNKATAVLSVGLAPGLTNLLALQAKKLMDVVDAIDISIMLGMGDQHGKAAIEWTVDNLNTSFQVRKEGRTVEVASFTEGRKTDFGAGLGQKTAYRFNFSDQHVLPRTLDVPTVSTRLCFDSAIVNGLLALLRTTGILRLLKVEFIRNSVVYGFGKLRFGTDRYAVKIDARGRKNNGNMQIECVLQGRNEAQITAKTAASLAKIVYESELPYCVYHIEQLIELEQLLPSIRDAITMELRVNGILQMHNL